MVLQGFAKWSMWLAVTLLILVSRVYAVAPRPSQFVLDSWGIKTGLPEETIYSVEQTKDGYLWLATANGLVRYDGSSFQIRQPRQDLGAKPAQEPGESHISLHGQRFVFKQEILGIAAGPRNSLLVYSSSYGLRRFEGGTFRPGLNYPRPCNVVDMKEDRDGTLVVCRERVLRIVDDKVDELTRIPAGSPIAIRAASRDEYGRLWIGL